MSEIPTKELLDRFFDDESTPNSAKIRRNWIDKPALYDYINETGTELVDMSVDQLIELMKRCKVTDSISRMFAHHLRQIFDYYNTISKLKIINPFHISPELKGRSLQMSLLEDNKPLTFEEIYRAIGRLRKDFDQQKVEYIELLVNLFYCGIDNGNYLVNLKEENINHNEKCLSLIGKTVQLNDRAYQLLIQVHRYYTSDRNGVVYASYRGGYIPVLSKVYQLDELDDKDIDVIRNRYYHMITLLKDDNGDTINYSKIFWLGFYDYLVKNIGDEKVKELVTEKGHFNTDPANMLIQYARLYGISQLNLTAIKRYLLKYI